MRDLNTLGLQGGSGDRVALGVEQKLRRGSEYGLVIFDFLLIRSHVIT